MWVRQPDGTFINQSGEVATYVSPGNIGGAVIIDGTYYAQAPDDLQQSAALAEVAPPTIIRAPNTSGDPNATPLFIDQSRGGEVVPLATISERYNITDPNDPVVQQPTLPVDSGSLLPSVQDITQTFLTNEDAFLRLGPVAAAAIAFAAPLVATQLGVSQPVARAMLAASKAGATGEGDPLLAAAMSYGTDKAFESIGSLADKLGVAPPSDLQNYASGLDDLYGSSPYTGYAGNDVPDWMREGFYAGVNARGDDQYANYAGTMNDAGEFVPNPNLPPRTESESSPEWQKWLLGIGAVGGAAALGGDGRAPVEERPVTIPGPAPAKGSGSVNLGNLQKLIEAGIPAATAFSLLSGDSSGSGSALSRILSGTGNMNDWLSLAGQLGPSIIGAVASDRQSDRLGSLAEKYAEFGAPYRERLLKSYTDPESFLSSPEFTIPVQMGTDALSRSLSAKVGNPVGNPGALSEIQDYATKSFYGQLGNERSRLANFGGLANYNAAVPGLDTGTIKADSNVLNALGVGAANVLNPPSDNSLAALLKKLGTQENIFQVA